MTPLGFVYGIVASLFILFNWFAINMILQYKKVGPGKITFMERRYIYFSASQLKCY